jgi:hypothetical protein
MFSWFGLTRGVGGPDDDVDVIPKAPVPKSAPPLAPPPCCDEVVKAEKAATPKQPPIAKRVSHAATPAAAQQPSVVYVREQRRQKQPAAAVEPAVAKAAKPSPRRPPIAYAGRLFDFGGDDGDVVQSGDGPEQATPAAAAEHHDPSPSVAAAKEAVVTSE